MALMLKETASVNVKLSWPRMRLTKIRHKLRGRQLRDFNFGIRDVGFALESQESAAADGVFIAKVDVIFGC